MVDGPLCLGIQAADADVLAEVAAVACHDVVEGIVLILQAGRKRGGGEEQMAEAAYVCGTTHVCEVFCLAVCVRVLLRTIVAVAVHVLQRREQGQFLTPFLPSDVVC